jgi:hypothetical protein
MDRYLPRNAVVTFRPRLFCHKRTFDLSISIDGFYFSTKELRF